MKEPLPCASFELLLRPVLPRSKDQDLSGSGNVLLSNMVHDDVMIARAIRGRSRLSVDTKGRLTPGAASVGAILACTASLFLLFQVK